MTGYGREEDRARAAAAGFDCHFVKPADPVEIQAAIDRGRPTGKEQPRGWPTQAASWRTTRLSSCGSKGFCSVTVAPISRATWR